MEASLGFVGGARRARLCVDDGHVLDALHRAAGRISNAWDTRVGGTLADALTCNAVVKSFGAEAREDARARRRSSVGGAGA